MDLALTPEQAKDFLQSSDPFLLDVRTPEEYADGHIEGATNIPVNELEEHLSELPKEGSILVYCKAGGRCKMAAIALMARGFDKIHYVNGSVADLFQ